MEAPQLVKEQTRERSREAGEGGFSIVNPATGQKVGEYPLMSPEEVAEAVRRARGAFPAWSKTPYSTRARILRRAASRLAEGAEEYGRIIGSETGKTQLDALLAEIFPTCDLLHYYAKKGEKFLRPVKVGGSAVLPGRKAYYTFEPRGVVGVIAPWNYPFTLASGPVISALAAGNTVVLKPSSQTTASGKILEEVFKAAGLPPDVLQVITGSGPVTGRALIQSSELDMLFFTGSTEVGIEVNRAAAEGLVPVVMELGGKDSMIVTRNADLDRAAHAAVWGAFFNSGQTCTGVEFCFVDRSIYTAFLDRVLRIAERIEPGTLSGQMGSMTMEPQVRILEDQIQDAVAGGAKVRIGGARVKSARGLFFEPTVITGIRPEMKIWQEETFGPILPIVPYDTPEEAIRMANSTPYGLSGSVYSEDLEEARMYACRMETGSVNINDCLVTYALPSLPFGGVKASGVGTYHGESGIRNFCRIKSVTEFKGLYAKEFFHYPVASWVKDAMEALLVLLYSEDTGARWRALPKTARIAGDLIGGMWRKRRSRPRS
jgi:acyl-CoA reductase-like NAD-dependent aldehyde dehydrogenase